MAISDIDCWRGCDAQMSVAMGQECAAEDDACMLARGTLGSSSGE